MESVSRCQIYISIEINKKIRWDRHAIRLDWMKFYYLFRRRLISSLFAKSVLDNDLEDWSSDFHSFQVSVENKYIVITIIITMTSLRLFALLFLVVSVHPNEMLENSIEDSDPSSKEQVVLFADHTIPPLSRKMTEFINSLNTTWKASTFSC